MIAGDRPTAPWCLIPPPPPASISNNPAIGYACLLSECAQPKRQCKQIQPRYQNNQWNISRLRLGSPPSVCNWCSAGMAQDGAAKQHHPIALYASRTHAHTCKLLFTVVASHPPAKHGHAASIVCVHGHGSACVHAAEPRPTLPVTRPAAAGALSTSARPLADALLEGAVDGDVRGQGLIGQRLILWLLEACGHKAGRHGGASA